MLKTKNKDLNTFSSILYCELMSEAIYYFVAKFDSKKSAREGKREIKNYLIEEKKAYDYWQDHRSKGTYRKLLKLHPLALSFLDESVERTEDKCSNSLAGLLIDTQEPFSQCLSLDENFVLYSQEVWHMDNWNHLVRFAKSLKGCLGAIYESEEYADTDQVLFGSLKNVV